MEVFTTENNRFSRGLRPQRPPLIYLHTEILLPYLRVFLEKEIHKRYHNGGVMKTCDPVSAVSSDMSKLSAPFVPYQTLTRQNLVS